ncbi:MAG: efflux RND transporter periplasmic adaptor subunit [Pirellulales bacterium]
MKLSFHWLTTRFLAIAIPAAMIVALGIVLLVYGPQRGREPAQGEVWTCSMHPQIRLSEPGRCPICGMELITVGQLTAEQARMSKQSGIETEETQYRELTKEIRTIGKLDYNERRVAYLTARVDGRVDRVFADFTGITVKRNDHLVDIYSPELYSTQTELLLALEAHERATGDRRLTATGLEAARTKLRLFGILPDQIAEIEANRKVTTHLRIFAPIGGIVVEKNIREQQYVKEGDMLYRIAELDPIWLYLDIYEYDLAWIRPGQKVDVTVEAYPGEVFHGTIVFIDPFLDDRSRTVKVRVNLKNPDHRLKPAMYATAVIRVRLRADGTGAPTGLEGKYICPMHPEVVQAVPGQCTICEMPLEKVPDLKPIVENLAQANATEIDKAMVLAVRKSAVLDTGRRQVVYRKRRDSAFELVEVTLGPLAESKTTDGQPVLYYPVLDGLSPGDEVVVQGGFLLDSQRQLEGMPSLLYEQGQSAAGLHAGHGGPTGQPTSPTPAESPAKSPGMPSAHKH